jgi:DNA-binding transcriptional MerR regulator
MNGLRISDVARRAGVPVSTVRYYERIGIMPLPARSSSGYRIYDKAAEARLAFISRAKRLGLSLEEVAGLAEAWDGADCGGTRERLSSLLDTKRAEIAEQVRELELFSTQLAEVQMRLDASDAPTECAPDLKCCTPELGDVVVTLGTKPESGTASLPPPLACTLDIDDRPARLSEFAALATHLTGWSRDELSLRMSFDRSPEAAALVRSLLAKEEQCCSFLSFEVRDEPNCLEWIVRAPSRDASPTLDEFLPLLRPEVEVQVL